MSIRAKSENSTPGFQDSDKQLHIKKFPNPTFRWGWEKFGNVLDSRCHAVRPFVSVLKLGLTDAQLTTSSLLTSWQRLRSSRTDGTARKPQFRLPFGCQIQACYPEFGRWSPVR